LTPKRIFEYISSSDQGVVNWNRIRFFWCDERCVSPDDDESNFHMARLYLFKNLDIPAHHIFRIFGEADPPSEAIRYSRIISRNVPIKRNLPEFDLILLGLGEDGHTASLFPGNTGLFYSENLCEVAIHPQTGQKRITLTGTVINNARNVVFLVTGPEKAKIVADLPDDNETRRFPASLVHPGNGTLTWLLDADAARLLHINR